MRPEQPARLSSREEAARSLVRLVKRSTGVIIKDEVAAQIIRSVVEPAYDWGIAEGRRQAATDVRAFAERRRLVMLAASAPERHAVMGAYGLAADVAATGLPPGTEQEKALARLVGPWEPAPAEHRFDPSSVRDTTVQPYGFLEESDDPYCVCGGAWLGDDGCETQQPGWRPPAPYDGPSIEELLPAEQPEPARNPRYGTLGTPEPAFDDSCDYDAWGADFGKAEGARCINDDPAHREVHHPEPARRRHDPGELMEEPDLFARYTREPTVEACASVGHLFCTCPGGPPVAEQPEDGTP